MLREINIFGIKEIWFVSSGSLFFGQFVWVDSAPYESPSIILAFSWSGIYEEWETCSWESKTIVWNSVHSSTSQKCGLRNGHPFSFYKCLSRAPGRLSRFNTGPCLISGMNGAGSMLSGESAPPPAPPLLVLACFFSLSQTNK